MKRIYTVVMIWLAKVYHCYLWRWHDWTCDAAEGIPATPEQLATGIEGFYDYAKMYCKRCGKVSDLSHRFRRPQ